MIYRIRLGCPLKFLVIPFSQGRKPIKQSLFWGTKGSTMLDMLKYKTHMPDAFSSSVCACNRSLPYRVHAWAFCLRLFFCTHTYTFDSVSNYQCALWGYRGARKESPASSVAWRHGRWSYPWSWRAYTYGLPWNWRWHNHLRIDGIWEELGMVLIKRSRALSWGLEGTGPIRPL